jgi:O-antigen/teichoic acid export membrane protein
VSDTKPLDSALLSGLGWTAVLRWTSEVASWAATLFVARLLVPGDYGLIAMATIPIGLVRMVEDFGLDAILVQDRSIVGARQAQLAGFILGLGFSLTILTLALANPIAAFFNEPPIAGLISLLSLLFVADALQVVPRANLQRKLRFRRLAALLLIQVVATQAILIAAALAGLEAWSLAVSNVGGVAIVTLVLWIWEPHPIHWPSGLSDLAKPLLQGWRVMASRFAYYAYATSDQTIIGRMLGKDALGAYSFVLTFSSLPFQEVSSVVTKVVPGIFSEVQHRTEELRRYFLLLTEFMAFLTLPMTVGLALTADLVISVALGPNWTSVVAPLQVMCVYAAFQGIQILISPILVWTGQFRAQMWCAILTGVSLPLGFLVAAPHGLVAIAAVWSLLYPLTNVPAVLIGLRTVRASMWQWLETARPAACACVLMAVAVIAVRNATSNHGELFRFGVAVAVGAVVYTAAVWFLFRARVIALIDVVKRVHAHPQAAPSLATPA